jgi:hypothetical protein
MENGCSQCWSQRTVKNRLPHYSRSRTTDPPWPISRPKSGPIYVPQFPLHITKGEEILFKRGRGLVSCVRNNKKKMPKHCLTGSHFFSNLFLAMWLTNININASLFDLPRESERFYVWGELETKVAKIMTSLAHSEETKTS